MTYGFEERDYSLDKFEDSFTPEKPLLDLSGFRPTTPLVSAIRALGSPTAQAGYRGIASGLSLGLEVISDDEEVKDQTIFDYIVDGAAERAAKMRIDNEDFAKKQGLGGGIAYGLTYGLSGFFGTFGNPALYGQGLASARTKSELAAGVDPATAQKIGAIEGVTGAVGSVIPFFGKTLVQRLGFGAAANIIPGIGQRAAEGAVFGDRYASRAPEVFDPVAITVDALLGGSFGYLAGIADKPSSIPDQDINDALDLNVKVKQADSAPGMPNETSFAIHNKIMDEMVAARREYRQPDFRALADAEFKDSPEQIRQMQEALDEIEAWRGDDGEVKMMPSEVSDARKQIEPMYNRVLTDLEKTGRYTPEQSQQFAKLTSRVYRTLSKRTGMDVDELEAQFPLKTVSGSVEGVLNQTAFHGGPYRFSKFTLNAVGTGEGNAAFGWGLYFAGKKAVGQFYRDTLGEFSFSYDGKDLAEGSPRKLAAELLFGQQGNKEGALEDADGFDNAQAIKREIKALDYEKLKKGGQLYRVEIPDDELMLRFDKPLASQPQSVKAALKDSGLWKDLKDNLSDYAAPMNTRGALNGENIYNYLEWKFGGAKAASLRLNELGIKGIKYPSGTIADSLGKGSFNYVVFDDQAVQIAETYYQGADGDARGNYNPVTQTINLSEISDPSTFVHELGHHLFEMLGKLAANPKAPKQIQDDFRALVEHGGMKVEDWYTASLETRRNAHERVAEDFETYLMDGSAPTPELKTMFGMIRDWMLEVYKTISGQVKPEIKAVFDRMLATDEQLAMKVMTPDYAAIAKRTEATKSMTLDNYLEEAKTTLDPESTVTIEGKPVKVADLLEDDPIATQESTGMKKLVECMLNVR